MKDIEQELQKLILKVAKNEFSEIPEVNKEYYFLLSKCKDECQKIKHNYLIENY